MTIAVGFRCADGIVLAADSQYSQDISKGPGQKISPIASNRNFALTIAGAGAADNMKRAVKAIEAAAKARIGARVPEILEIQEIVEDVLRDFYRRYIDCVPAKQRGDFEIWLLVGVWTAPQNIYLLSTARNTAIEVLDHRCIGMGSYLTDYLAHVLWVPGMSVEEAKPLASHLVWAAKEYVDCCGGRTFVRVLRYDGRDVMLSQEEIEDGAEYIASFFKDLSAIAGILVDSQAPESLDLTPFAQIFKKRILAFRERNAARAKLPY